MSPNQYVHFSEMLSDKLLADIGISEDRSLDICIVRACGKINDLVADLERVTRERDEALREATEARVDATHSAMDAGTLKDEEIARLTADLAEARKDGDEARASLKSLGEFVASWRTIPKPDTCPGLVNGILDDLEVLLKVSADMARSNAARDAGKGAKP